MNPPILKRLLTFVKFVQKNALAVFLCTVFAVIWLQLLFTKFVYFGYYDWDFALAAQTMWSLTHLSVVPSLYESFFLVNHAEYFAFLLTPLYGLFPHPLTLLALKIFSVAGGGFILYLLTKNKIGNAWAALLMLLYFIYPANTYMLIYEFNFESLAIFFFFLLYYLFKKERLWAFAICCFVTALIKENVALTVSMFGLLALFTPRKKKTSWVLIPLIIGGGIFLLSMFWVMPHLRALAGAQTSNQYFQAYYLNSLGPATSSFIDQAIGNMHHYLGRLTTSRNISYLQELFWPLSVFPLFSPQVLLLGLPIFLQNLLSSSPAMKTVVFHYAATLTPFLFLATAETLILLKKIMPARFYFIVFLILATLGSLNAWEQKSSTTFAKRFYNWQDPLDSVRWQAIQQLPDNAAVITNFQFLPQLSQRKSLYTFYKVWINNKAFPWISPYHVPEPLQYALWNGEDPWFWDTVLSANDLKSARVYLQRIHDFFANGNWNTALAIEEIVLFDNSPKKGKQLVEVNKKPFPHMPHNALLNVDGKIQLIGFNSGKKEITPSQLFPLNFYWQAKEDIDSVYRLRIKLMKGREVIRIWDHRIGYGFTATPLWKKGDYIKEKYTLLLPELAAGDYWLIIRVLDDSHDRLADLSLNKKPVNSFTLGKIESSAHPTPTRSLRP